MLTWISCHTDHYYSAFDNDFFETHLTSADRFVEKKTLIQKMKAACVYFDSSYHRLIKMINNAIRILFKHTQTTYEDK